MEHHLLPHPTPVCVCVCACACACCFLLGEARAIVEAALGRPISEVFATFEEEPLGVASIGEAHRATLLDGRPVVREPINHCMVCLKRLGT